MEENAVDLKKQKRKKIIKILAIILIPVILFFGIYGISRIDLAVQHGKIQRGSVVENPFSAELEFDLGDYYVINMPEDKALTVLFITDLHIKDQGWYAQFVWVQNALNKSTYDSVQRMIENFNPDFVFVMGDLTSSQLNDQTFEDFCTFMAGFDTPWTFVFGNHDSEERADKPAIAQILSDAKNCVFDAGFTNLVGLGNTVIPVMDNGKLVYAFVVMDFGDWQQRKDPEKKFSTLEVGWNDTQLEWYRWIIEGLQEENPDVNTMLVAHLPHHSFTYAVQLGGEGAYLSGKEPFSTDSEFGYETENFKAFWDEYRETGIKGDFLTMADYEDFKANDELFKLIKELGSTNSMISGHNHADGYSILFDGITYTSVVKTGSIYTNKKWDNGNRGGTLFSLTYDKDGRIEASSRTYYDK